MGSGYYGFYGLADLIAAADRGSLGLTQSGPSSLFWLAQQGLASPTRLTLHWHRCGGHVWGSFTRVDLGGLHFNGREGVYVIWRPTDRRCVRVGQGNIRERLTAHRVDREITDCTPYTGELLVTWADVDWRYRDGVERYLGEVLQPIVGRRFPDVASIEVNLPS